MSHLFKKIKIKVREANYRVTSDTRRFKHEQGRKSALSAEWEGLRPLGPVSMASDSFYIYTIYMDFTGPKFDDTF